MKAASAYHLGIVDEFARHCWLNAEDKKDALKFKDICFHITYIAELEGFFRSTEEAGKAYTHFVKECCEWEAKDDKEE